MLSGKEKAYLLIALLNEKGLNLIESLPDDIVAQIEEDEPTVSNEPRKIAELLEELEKEIQYARRNPPLPAAEPFALDETPPPPVLEKPSSLGLFQSPAEPEIEPESPKVEDPKEYRDPTLRTPAEIALVLSKQKPQIMAFVLSKIDPDTKDIILEKLPQSLRNQVQAINVDTVPLSDNIFNKIYNSVFKKSEEELLQESEQPKHDEEETPLTPISEGGFGSFFTPIK